MVLRRHSGMDDMDMGGMDMGTGVLFTPENQFRAKVLWYLIATCIGFMTLARATNALQAWQRRRRHANHRSPARPDNKVEQLLATVTAVYREMAYPQLVWFTGALSKWFTPPPTGRCLLLTAYWIIVLTLLWSDVLIQPDDEMYPYRWEKVGFRAAWISVSQIPFIYLLSCKFNPMSLLTGISYERFNWLHRWTARTVFLTVIVHWSYFFYEWWQADFVEYELELMPMVRYGFGAWAVIGYMIVSGLPFLRAAGYELFVLQHLFAAAILLWLLHVHVPAYAQYNVWTSIGFLAFDWGTRIVLGVIRNLHLPTFTRRLPGFAARLEPLTEGMVKLTIDEPAFTWKAGQHVYLSIPSVRPLELHPFTIANSALATDGTRKPLTMMIKARKGFTKALYLRAQKDAIKPRARRAFLSWPMGSPPSISHYDTVLLLACSSGASFVVPMLQSLLRDRGCVHRVQLHWMIKCRDYLSWYAEALSHALEAARTLGLQLDIAVHVTRFDIPASSSEAEVVDKGPIVRTSDSTGSVSLAGVREKLPMLAARPVGSPMDTITITSNGRPSIESLIRPGVESACGETAVISCGGLGFTAEVRTFVAVLSDERAVHKGTGAQGIYLFTETYGW